MKFVSQFKNLIKHGHSVMQNECSALFIKCPLVNLRNVDKEDNSV